ncbi:MAG: FAD-dependent oxidoreductase [Proteobacteria bacterium]|nr:FAD-dependent oxidoreductase [Pseudomonadota bacterium]
MFNHLFSPITINGLQIKNRIAYPSLGLLYAYDRKLNDRYYHFFKEIAAGGAGIVTVGPVGIDYLGSGIVTLALTDDQDIPSFKKLTDIIRNEGASPWIQLFHAGAYSYPITIGNQQPMAPSALFSKYSKSMPREMTIEDIKTTQMAYADAAERAKAAGFDGVEILASAGYLITQFLSPVKNQRKDEYGGSLGNRLRFPRELLQQVRTRVGKDYPMTVRMAGNDFVPGSNTDEETPLIAQAYETAGVDMINVTGGWHESRVPQLPMELPRGCYAYLALNIKKAVSVPVMASNRIASPRDAEDILRNGFADMVNLGRVLIADPQWPTKAAQGKENEIRPCVGCSQGCTDSVFSGKPVYCIGNPRAGFEGERVIKKSASPKRIMVVGAGVAGLEAAVTASQAGHQVEIYEKRDRIGGQIWIAGTPPNKQELWEFARYYKAMVNKYQIPLHLNCTVSLDMIRGKKPDHVILAEGAQALSPPIPGLDEPGVLSSWTVLEDSPLLGKEVAVIGGGAVGVETAMFIAHKGTLTPDMLHFLFAYDAVPPLKLKEYMFRGSSRVTIFEMMDKAGNGIGKSTKWVALSNLERYGVKVMTQSKVLSAHNGIIRYENTDGIHEKSFDTLVVAAGSRSVKTLSAQLEKENIPFTPIGDGVRPGKLDDAIHGGFLAALNV